MKVISILLVFCILVVLGFFGIAVLVHWAGGDGSDALDLFLLFLFFLGYFLPLVVAIKLQHPKVAPIAVINIFLGWSVVGWVAALAWAVCGIAEEVSNSNYQPQIPMNASAPLSVVPRRRTGWEA